MDSIADAPLVSAGGPEIPWWLRNRHLQSIYPSFPPRRAGVERRARPLVEASRDWIVECADGTKLLARYAVHEAAGARPNGCLVVLLHGWEGSSESLYVLTLGQQLYERGYDVVRLNLRDHGPTHHLNRELFHSCRLPEMLDAVCAIASRWPDRQLQLVGFSLGGNFWLRVGARAPVTGLKIARIVAISPVVDPGHTLATLEAAPWFYRQYFVWKWVRSLKRKQLAWPQLFDFTDILRDRRLTPMTDVLVRRYTDFADMESYLRGYAITGNVLATLAAPSRIIASADDPMIPAEDYARITNAATLRTTLAPQGGHCGFVIRGNGTSWVGEEVLRELRTA